MTPSAGLVGSWAAADDRRERDVIDLDRLVEQPVEEEAALARVATVEAERELIEVEVELVGPGGALMVPSSQRLSSAETRWTRGIATCAGSPLAARLVAWWKKPAAASPL